jgi:hypothetical protein
VWARVCVSVCVCVCVCVCVYSLCHPDDLVPRHQKNAGRVGTQNALMALV